MEQLKQILTPIITENCVNKFLTEFDFLDEPCLKLTLSKGLGMGIIAGSVLVKVPQIVKIWRNRSAAGISFIGQCLELFAVTATLAYAYSNGFPFSSWGEACFLAFQTAVIAGLVLLFNYQSTLLGLSFLIAYAGILYALVTDYTSSDVLWSMQAANVPVIVTSKMIQAVTNYRNQSTGQLSAVTAFMLFIGSMARIFTSIQETGDQIVILTYAVATAVNGLIVFQMLWYWNSQMKSSKKRVAQGGAKGKSGKANGGTPNKKSQKPKRK